MTAPIARPDNRRWWLLAYLVAGVALYAPILNTWFVADDWDFLILSHRATSPLVCFAPLLGRFLRPLEVLTYYGNYELFGLRPFPYHLTVVLVHVLNARLVSRLALRLGTSTRVAFGAGLVFVVFGGHTEAVTWLGGAADVYLATFLVGGLLLLARGLDAERAGVPLTAATLVFAAGFLAKETAAVAPGLVIAYGACRLLSPHGPAGRVIRRTLAVAVASSGGVILYMLMRWRIFGSVFGAYHELSTSHTMVFAEVRAFVLRSFVPAGRIAVELWTRQLDVLVMAFGITVLIIVLARKPASRLGLVFLPAAIAVALAPALPLTIAVGNTVSERYVYTATAFACVLVVWLVEILCGKRRTLATAAIAVLVLLNSIKLVRANRPWIQAGTVARTVMAQVIEAVRASPPEVRTIVLNLPDTINGAFVVRAAFQGSFELMAPDVAHPEQRAAWLSSTMSLTSRDVTFVERTGPRSFSLLLKQGLFAQPGVAEAPEYRVDHWTIRSFDITFNPTSRPARVFYTSEGALHEAGRIGGGNETR